MMMMRTNQQFARDRSLEMIRHRTTQTHTPTRTHKEIGLKRFWVLFFFFGFGMKKTDQSKKQIDS